jgi:hypothetical protein
MSDGRRYRNAVYSPLQVAVHDGEKHLKEQVDGVNQHRQQVQPRLARHCESEFFLSSNVCERRELLQLYCER